MSRWSRLETSAFATLPATTQEVIRTSDSATDLAGIDLGLPRSVSIGEVIVWAKYHSCMFVAGVLKTLNPDGCLEFGGALDRRARWLKDEAKRVNTAFKAR
jgi:hypothetical protein